MEHAVVELVPGQRSTPAAPAAPAAPVSVSVSAVVQPDRGRARRRSRRPEASAGRPVRHRQQAVRLRADMREFESALARWAR